MTTYIALTHDPRTKDTFAAISRSSETRYYPSPTPASIKRLIAIVIKLQAVLRPSMIGNVGWFATANESEVKK